MSEGEAAETSGAGGPGMGDLLRAGLVSLVVSLALVGGFAGVGFLVGGRLPKAPPDELTLHDSRAFYKAQPRYLRPLPYTETPAGLANLRAETCGSCHREIYEEWRVSTHARAWEDDAQFQEELAKGKATPGKDTTWICVNCHTPLVNQLPQLVAGLVEGQRDQPRYLKNPNYDANLQLEAVTCATCHVRDGGVLGPYGDTTAPHPVRKAPELLEASLCTQCHQANAHLSDIALACVFDTGLEWKEGPAAQRGETCQSCHMPAVERPLMPGFPKRKTRRHWFGGSLIPKHPKFEAELAQVREHYDDGVTLRWVELPEQAQAGSELELRFAAKNEHAGHHVPTGDPERFLLLRAEVRAGDQLLASREERIGAVYQWDPVEKLSDNRIAAGEERTWSLTFAAPAEGAELKLVLIASKHRISQENFDYHHLEGRYVAGREYLRQERALPLR